MTDLPDIDIAIVGAGPAGVAASLVLADKMNVSLFDAVFTAAPTKPCGGLLSEAAQESLATLGLTIPTDILVGPQCFCVRTVDLENGLEGSYPRTYTNLDRRRFDDYLRSLVPPSVTCQPVRVHGIKREADCYRLSVDDVGRVRELTCRRLIVADGGGSKARRALFPAHAANTMTAVQAHYKTKANAAEYACYYDQRHTPAYGWSLVKDDRLIVGGAFLRQGSSAAFAGFEQAVFNQLGRVVPDRLLTEACPLIWSTSKKDLLFGDDTALFVGEAAGLISPSSFEGISFALESGYAAGQAMRQHINSPLAHYKNSIGHLLIKHRGRRIKARLLAWPYFRTTIIRSGIGQIKSKIR